VVVNGRNGRIVFTSHTVDGRVLLMNFGGGASPGPVDRALVFKESLLWKMFSCSRRLSYGRSCGQGSRVKDSGDYSFSALSGIWSPG
jgi:hypothetical protein